MSSTTFPFLRQWRLPQAVTCTAQNANGAWIAAGLADGSLALNRTDDTGEEPYLLPTHQGSVTALAPDADAHAFLSGGADGCVFLIDPGLAAPTPLYEKPGDPVTHIASAPEEGLRAFARGPFLHRLDEDGNEAAPAYTCPAPIAALSYCKTILAAACGDALLIFAPDAHDKPTQTLPLAAPAQAFLWLEEKQTLFALLSNGAVETFVLNENGLFEKAAASFSEETNSHATFLANDAANRFLLIGGGAQALAHSLDATPRRMQLGEPGPRHVAALAPHPYDPVVCLGYDDGALALAPLDSRKELVLMPPLAPGEARCAGLFWNLDGDCLQALFANGLLLLFTQRSIQTFLRTQRA